MFSLWEGGLISFEKLTYSKPPTAATSEMETCFIAVRKSHPKTLRIRTPWPNPLFCSSNFILLYADLVKLHQLKTGVTKQRRRPIGKKKERKSWKLYHKTNHSTEVGKYHFSIMRDLLNSRLGICLMWGTSK